MATYNNVITNVSGSVGIGTTNVTSRLTLLGSTTNLSEPILTVRPGAAQATATAVLDVQNNAGTSLLFISGSGRVGIGTTPSATIANARLEVNGSVIPTTHLNTSYNLGEPTRYWGTTYTNDLYAYNANTNSIAATGGVFQVAGPVEYSLYASTTNRVGVGAIAVSSVRLVVSGTTTGSDTTLRVRHGVANGSNLPVFDVQNSAGTSLLYVSGSGNVGIGAIPPISKLHVNSADASATYATVGNNNNGILIGVSSPGVGQILAYSNNAITFGDYSTQAEYARITSVGVGIGTNNPGARLHISGSTTGTTPTLLVRHGVANGSDLPVFNVQNSAGTSLLFVSGSGRVGIGASTPDATIQIIGPSFSGFRIGYLGASESYLDSATQYFRDGIGNTFSIITSSTHRLFTSNTERLRIDSSGNVGIGTNNPLYTLSVSGRIYVHDGFGSYTNAGWRGNFYNAAQGKGVAISYDASSNGHVIQGLASGGNGDLNLNFYGGNVGVGATSTPQARLHVTGSSTVAEQTMLVRGGTPSQTGPVLEVESNTGATLFVVSGSSGGNVGIGTGIPSAKFEVVGVSGSLFSVADNLSGSLFSVNTISGLPILEVFSDNTLVAGAFNTNALVVTGSLVGIGTRSPTDKLMVSGTLRVTSVSNATGDFATYSATGVLQKRAASQVQGDIGLGNVNNLSVSQIFNNTGANHNTRSDFNNITDFGYQYVLGTTNGPNLNSATQYYAWTIGLGNEYPFTQYAAQFAIGRQVSNPYMGVRYREATTWGSWQRLAAGNADTLTTTRTIWGQNFNGSADVTGNLTSVGNITGTGTIGINPAGGSNISLNTTGAGATIIGGLYSISAQSIALSVGTDSWVRLATVPNLCDFKLNVRINSTNTEECINIAIKGNYYNVNTKIDVDRVTYAERLREVYVDQPTVNGGNKTIYLRVRSASFSPTVAWYIYNSTTALTTLHNDDMTGSPPTSGVSVKLSTSLNTQQATNSNLIVSGTNNPELGVGIDNPAAKLHVNAPSGIEIARFGHELSTGFIGFAYSTSTMAGYLGNGSSTLTGASSSELVLRSEGGLALATSGNNRRVTIDTSGNVGVGTSTPSARLFITGSTTTTQAATVVRAGVSSPITPIFEVQDVLGNTLFNVTGSGNVGIGFTRTGFYTDDRLVIGSPTGTSPFGIIIGESFAAGAARARLGLADVNRGIGLNSNSDTVVHTWSTNSILLGHGTPTSLTERLRIDSSGNVGIGTNNTNSNRVAISGGNLSVTGSILPGDNATTYDLGSTSYRWRDVYARSGSYTGDVTISGNLTVGGTQTIVNSETVNIKDNIILLNSTASPQRYGGIYVADQAVGTTGSFRWDSDNNRWEAGLAGSEVALPTGTGTTNYVTKWTATNTIGNSVLYDDGTNVGIGTTSASTFAASRSLVIGQNSVTEQNALKIFGGNNSDRAPVVSLFRSGNTEGIITQTSGFMAFGNGGGIASYTDAALQSYTSLYISTVGNVGIGYSSSISARLQVTGSSTASTPTMIVREGVVNPTGGVGVLNVQNSAGTSLFFVSGSGNVGVGTNVPSAKLHVRDTTNRNMVITSGNTGMKMTSINDAGAEADIGLQGNTVQFLTSATERARIDSSGQIFRWHTYTDAANYKALRISSSTYSGAEYATISAVGIGTFQATNIGIVLAPTGSGAISANMPDGTTIGGNARGTNAVDLQMSRSGNTQVASGNYSFVVGQNNTANAIWSVAAGVGNSAGGNGSIAAGQSNTASGGSSVSMGYANVSSNSAATSFGSTNTASGVSSFVAGQFSLASGAQSIAMGQYVTGSANNAVAIGSGSIASGISSIAMGDRNFAQAANAVAIGFNNTASSTTAVAIGNQNTASTSLYPVAIGQANTSSGVVSVAIGNYNLASGDNSFVTGRGSKGYLWAQRAHGGINFANQGDAQRSVLVASTSTTNASLTEMFLDGASASKRAILPASTTWAAEIEVVARASTGTSHACFKRRCLISRDGSNNTSLVGSVQVMGSDIGSNVGSPPTGWAVTVSADDTNESLKIEVTGAAATNIRWVARIDLVEVGY